MTATMLSEPGTAETPDEKLARMQALLRAKGKPDNEIPTGISRNGRTLYYNGYQSPRPRRRSTPSAPRDSQKQKVYDAEGVLAGGQKFASLADVQAYVDKLCESAWFRRRWGRKQIEVRPGHHAATGGYGVIRLGLWARIERVVLHEVGHCVLPIGDRHGPHFARVLLELAEHAFGAETSRTLRESFRKHRVKIGPPIALRADVPPAPEKPKWWRIEAHVKLRDEDRPQFGGDRWYQVAETVQANDLLAAIALVARSHQRRDWIDVEARQTRAPSVKVRRAASARR